MDYIYNFHKKAEDVIKNRVPIRQIWDILPDLPLPRKKVNPSDYDFRNSCGHIEVYDKFGKFQYSADTMSEALQELGRAENW